ncbi:MAG TPA: isoprenylcysteine carboxylmethyltransferase family protein [Terriglobales bacterium]|jgi:protein-S-isoprenylcysteine O-methyltransferase Ste14
MHYPPLWQIELIPWDVFIIVWLFGVLRLKRTKATEPDSSRLYTSLVLGCAGFLLFEQAWHLGVLGMRVLPQRSAVGWAGVVLTFLGAAIAIWARIIIGSNWSSRVTLKVDHQLIRSGPYKYVRHPIYTGMILALLGTAVVVGELRGALAIVLAVIAFSLKAQREEKFMQSEFGETYRQYQGQTGFLVPRC